MIILKKLLYYITDHGLGHITRSVAMIRELEKNGIEVIIRNSNVVYLNSSLPTTRVITGITDVGPIIEKNGISINENKTKEVIGKWIKTLQSVSDKETQLVSKIKPDLVVSDISVMPFLAAHNACIRSVAISNFSWVDVLNMLAEEQISLLSDAYRFADLAIKLPLGTKMNTFQNKKHVGFVCKSPTQSRESARKKLGIKESEKCVFINLGEYFSIKPTINGHIQIISTGARVDSNNVTYIKPWTEGQDIVAASDLVICKCGYGMISECLTNGVPFLYVFDDKHGEQNVMSDELIKMGLKNHITEDTLNEIILDEKHILATKSRKEENSTKSAAQILIELVR